MDWRDWKTWGTVLGVVSTALLLFGKVGGCFGTVTQVVELPRKVSAIEARVEDGEKYRTIDSMATSQMQEDQAEVAKVVDMMNAQVTALSITMARVGEHMGVDVEVAGAAAVK